jgi:hypothetical protein
MNGILAATVGLSLRLVWLIRYAVASRYTHDPCSSLIRNRFQQAQTGLDSTALPHPMAVTVSDGQNEPERSCTNHTENDKPIIPSEARSYQSSYNAQANNDQNQQHDYAVDGEFGFNKTQDGLKNLGRRVNCRHDGDEKNPKNETKSTRSTSKSMGHLEYICTSGRKKCSPILPYIKRTL